MTTDTDDLTNVNGLDAATGDYLVPALSRNQWASIARGESFDPAQLSELRWRSFQGAAHYGVKEGVDPTDLAQAGWGVIFSDDADPAIREALGELLAHRQAQSNRVRGRYREYAGPNGLRPNESKNAFLARQGIGPGPVDPDVVPYYLLIAGDPATIPFAFQSQLDVAYAVGRIHFDRLEDYAHYAHSVVAAETMSSPRAPVAAFFGPQNHDDSTTRRSGTHLVPPLADALRADQSEWSLRTVLGEEATKSRLAALLGGAETPALLFTAGHGIGFDQNDQRQYQQQGALVCQDWPGPIAARGHAISADWYFAGDDVPDDASLRGLIAFNVACFGGGTPQFDEFAHLRKGIRERSQIAPAPFVAGLPKRLLAHPRGGALAVISHIERAWTTSFLWHEAGPQLGVFQSALQRLVRGHPVGSAMEYFNMRYAELSTLLSSELEEARFGKQVDSHELSMLWTANNDARSYAVIGDPAVRLNVTGVP